MRGSIWGILHRISGFIGGCTFEGRKPEPSAPFGSFLRYCAQAADWKIHYESLRRRSGMGFDTQCSGARRLVRTRLGFTTRAFPILLALDVLFFRSEGGLGFSKILATSTSIDQAQAPLDAFQATKASTVYRTRFRTRGNTTTEQ